MTKTKQFFIDNAISEDRTSLNDAKLSMQEASRQEVQQGSLRQEDLFFIPLQIVRGLRFQYKG